MEDPNEVLEYDYTIERQGTIGSESVVLWGLRLWQVIAVFSTGFTILVVGVCCVCKCRIPRNNKEIEEGIARKKAAKMRRTPFEHDGATQSTRVVEEIEMKTVSSDNSKNSLKRPHPVPVPRSIRPSARATENHNDEIRSISSTDSTQALCRKNDQPRSKS